MKEASYWVKSIQDEAFAAGLDQRAKELADAREVLREMEKQVAELRSALENIFVTTVENIPHADGTGIVLNHTIVAETLRGMAQ